MAVPTGSSPGRPRLTILTRLAWNTAEAEAVRLGHEISDPEWDTEASLVGYCTRCDALMAADATESPTFTGEAIAGPCSKEHWT
jgi:hypothetical protein